MIGKKRKGNEKGWEIKWRWLHSMARKEGSMANGEIQSLLKSP